MGQESHSFLRRRSPLRHAHARRTSERSEVGLWPQLLHVAQCRSWRRLARQSRQFLGVSANHAGRLRPRLQTLIFEWLMSRQCGELHFPCRRAKTVLPPQRYASIFATSSSPGPTTSAFIPSGRGGPGSTSLRFAAQQKTRKACWPPTLESSSRTITIEAFLPT